MAFLTMGTNAEAAAMGDAQVAFSRDAFSTYWNPAGLAAADLNSVSASYHAWIGNTQTYAAATRLGVGENSAFGLFVTANGSDDLDAFSEAGTPEGTFSVQYVSAGVGYGRSFGPLRAGVTAKYLAERIYTESASGYGIDLGLQASMLDEGLHLGAAVQNLGSMNDLVNEDTELPTAVRLGGAVFPLRVLMSEDEATLLETVVTAEFVYFMPREISQVHIGVGAEVLDVIELRLGYITNDDARRYSFGLGFGYEGFVFDYAFLPLEGGFQGPGHMLTLSYLWR